MKKGLVYLLLVATLMLIPVWVHAYGVWGESDTQEDALAYLDQLDQAIKKATAGRSAHPDFLSDLKKIAMGLREALVRVNSDPNQGEYAVNIPRVAGKWSARGGTGNGTLLLEQDGGKLTGTIFGSKIFDGTIDAAGNIYFLRDIGTLPAQVYRGTLNAAGTEITGSFDCSYSRATNVAWSAKLLES